MLSENDDKKTQYFALHSSKVLGISLDAEAFDKLTSNLQKNKPYVSIDLEELFVQHLTTGTKMIVASQNLRDMDDNKNFYEPAILDYKGRQKFKQDYPRTLKFQTSLECFFVFCGGAITSAARELFIAYNLQLNWKNVNFYFVLERLKLEFEKSPITDYLNKVNSSDWYQYLNGARNRAEHGQLPLFHITQEGKLFIADDQSVKFKSLSTNKGIVPTEYCQKLLDETVQVINFVSADINKLLYGS